MKKLLITVAAIGHRCRIRAVRQSPFAVDADTAVA